MAIEQEPVSNEIFDAIFSKNKEIKDIPEKLKNQLGILSALLMERIHFFEKSFHRSEGLLLLMIASTSWDLIKHIAKICPSKNEKYKDCKYLGWFYEQFEGSMSIDVVNEAYRNTVQFIRGANNIYEKMTMLRHPANKVDEIEQYYIFN